MYAFVLSVIPAAFLARKLMIKTFYHHDTLRLKSLPIKSCSLIQFTSTWYPISVMWNTSRWLYGEHFQNFSKLPFISKFPVRSQEYTRFVSLNCTFKVMVLLSALIAVTIQLFMCWRIWICMIFFRSIFSCLTDGLFVGLSVAQIIVVFSSFAITMVYFEKSWSLLTWTKLADLSKISRAVNGLNFGGDIAITFVMVYFLRTSRSGIKRLLVQLLSGVPTRPALIVCLIKISIWPNTFIYITFYCALARLYANSFLATLNARDQLRKSNRPLESSLFSNPTLSGLEWARAMASDTVITSSDIPKSSTNPLFIKQEVDTHVHHDMELDDLAVKTLSSNLPV
ncbi:hypothetical protein F5876DRAFT_65698 [Lentinula aff. lateritia]|uniref:Uncharacterized protein n=1 Tax=Lentinula aff. lateritia TaxID=2804960 RepID=A0ACC1U088_9AGAR|nr:hypothetical protein F5876DRAFT_65698 [Lentinula aff. lateritia]